jgi:hypothetical protein
MFVGWVWCVWGVLGMYVECMWAVCKVRMGCVWGGCGEDVSSGMDVGWPVDFSQVLGKTPTERSSSRVLQCTYLFDRLASFIKYCSETTLTGESWFHISPPRGFEPVTLVAGSKQVSPLDQ